jgi:predicted glutamine amidotransferase
MCIAIVNKNSMLPASVFQHSFENNPDGCGMAYIDGKKMVVEKELSSWQSMYQKYVEARQSTSKPILLHFRIGTSGIKDERNIHPFLINNNLSLIHNGMISYNSIDEDFSDTWHFTELLKSLKNPNNLLNSNSLEFQMLSAFTKGSKIALLHTNGNFSILNEDAGKWVDDTWYSNETYKECSYFNVGGKQVSKKSYFDDEPYNYKKTSFYSLGFVLADLETWKTELLDEDDIEWYIPDSVKLFNFLSYPDKMMLLLSLGNIIYTVIDCESAEDALTHLKAITGLYSMEDLYIHLSEWYIELATKSGSIYEAD